MKLYQMGSSGKSFIPSCGGKLILHSVTNMDGRGSPLLLEKGLGTTSPYAYGELDQLKKKITPLTITAKSKQKKSKFISL